MKQSLKTEGINVTNSLLTSGVLNIADGYQFMDNSYNTNNNIPSQFQFGTSVSQGNHIRNNFNLNNNGPVIFGETNDDKKQILGKFSKTMKDYPIISSYPWLYPISSFDKWSSNSQSILESSTTEFPVCKCLGKGLGNIEVFKVGNAINGNENKAGADSKHTNGLTSSLKSQSNYIDEPIYPFDGYIYSGTLVEVISQINQETGNRETVVIPYQSGRGIPDYPKNYQPSGYQTLSDSFLPWGKLTWPSSTNDMQPFLSPGIEPNNQSPIYGIVLDSYSSQSYQDRLFKSDVPKEPLIDDREPWYNHPAPHTIPASSFKGVLPDETQNTQGYLSPGPNSSNTFWSPWPRYFAYKSGDPVPVLTQGITTVRIGAAYNIALTSYGVGETVSATDKEFVPVQCIPLFQGERLEAGSLVYAAVKGEIQTPGPNVVYDEEATAAFSNGTIQTGVLGQTLWDLNADSTWGNIGWCGTPGLSFHNIPDRGVATLETLNGKTIPYLNQSNQGSIIVQGVTSVSPYPGLGNKYDPRTILEIGENPDGSYSDSQLWTILKNRFQLPGVSGRACLSQMVPDKAQPIGTLLETIVGTGKWPYDGLPVTRPVDSINTIEQGGANYLINGSTIGTRASSGTGTGLTVNWTGNNPTFPQLGQITTIPNIIAPGTGYSPFVDVTLQDDTLAYHTNPQFKGNNAAFVYDFGNSQISFLRGGTNYSGTSRRVKDTFNLSRNNAYISFEDNGSGSMVHDNSTAPTAPVSDYPQDFSVYTPGKSVVRIYSRDVPYNESAVFLINNISDGVCDLTQVIQGSNYPVTGGYRFFETEVINLSFRSPYVEYEIGASTSVGSIYAYDIGVGNKSGDQLLITDGQLYFESGVLTKNDENCTFTFNKPENGYQELSSGCPWYYSDGSNTYPTEVIRGDGVSSSFDVVTVPDPERIISNTDFELSPCFTYTQSTNPSKIGSEPSVFRVYYDTGLPDGATGFAEPWYIGRNLSFIINESPVTGQDQFQPLVGGSGYTDSNRCETYNMSANTLRIPLEIQNGVIITTDLTYSLITLNQNFYYNFDRYTDSLEDPDGGGTRFRIMSNNLPPEDQAVFRIVDKGIVSTELKFEMVSQGLNYLLPDGKYVFHTQRLDQENPTVSIETEFSNISNDNYVSFGQLRRVKLMTQGSNNKTNDILVVIQDNADNNGFFFYKNNMDYINLPPYANLEGYLVDTSEEAWNKYNEVMQTATNLMDKQVIIELRNNQGQYMENVLPSAQQFSVYMPPNENPYKGFY